jgi:hypothetical protein
MRPRILVAIATALAIVSWGAPAAASFHTFQIDELYSSPDGSVQFVELHEAFGFDNQEFLAGIKLTSSQGATTRVLTFPGNLPNSSTAGKRVLIGTPAFASLGVVTPDYIVPAPFLFPGGGTLNYGNVDTVVYPPLPGDGKSSVSRTGAVGINSPTNYLGQTGSIAPAAPAAVPGIPLLDRTGLAILATLLVLATLLTRRFR